MVEMLRTGLGMELITRLKRDAYNAVGEELLVGDGMFLIGSFFPCGIGQLPFPWRSSANKHVNGSFQSTRKASTRTRLSHAD